MPVTTSLHSRDRRSLVARLTAPRWTFAACWFVVLFLFLVNVQYIRYYDRGDETGPVPRLGGDFVAFYDAGRIVAHGDGSRLYDWERQRAEEARTWGVEEVERFIPFPYPAYVAAPYALLARVGFKWAYVINTLAMTAAAIASVLLLRSVSETVRENPLLVTVAVLASQPLSQVIYGGQLVAFSLLCFTGVYVALQRQRAVAAGIWLGLLLYKPQLALLLIAVLLWKGRWRTIGVAGATGSAMVLVGVAAAGWSWPRQMVEMLRSDTFASLQEANRPQMISLIAVAQQILEPESTAAYGVAGLCGVGVICAFVRLWRAAPADGNRFSIQFGLAMVVTLLVSPHALYYEAGLLVLPVIILIDHWRLGSAGGATEGPSSGQRLALIALFVVGHARFFIPPLAVDLFATFPIVVGFLLWQALRNEHRAIEPTRGKPPVAARAT